MKGFCSSNGYKGIWIILDGLNLLLDFCVMLDGKDSS